MWLVPESFPRTRMPMRPVITSPRKFLKHVMSTEDNSHDVEGDCVCGATVLYVELMRYSPIPTFFAAGWALAHQTYLIAMLCLALGLALRMAAFFAEHTMGFAIMLRRAEAAKAARRALKGEGGLGEILSKMGLAIPLGGPLTFQGTMPEILAEVERKMKETGADGISIHKVESVEEDPIARVIRESQEEYRKRGGSGGITS